MTFLTVYTRLRWTATRREPNEELRFIHYRRGHSFIDSEKQYIYLLLLLY